MILHKISKSFRRMHAYLNRQREGIKVNYFSQFFPAVLLNIFLVGFQFIYLWLRYKYINDTVPFWYSMPWGDYQLDYKKNLLLIPILSLFIFVAGIVLIILMRRFLIRYLSQVLTLIVSFSNLALTYSLYRIVNVASVPFPALISPMYMSLFIPFIASFLIVFFITPRFVSYARERGLVTNPALHQHPAMVLVKPSARGGGAIFALGFLLSALIFVPISKENLGIYFVLALITLLGLADDYQNTHPRSFLTILEIPFLRLILLFLIVSTIVFFGIKISFIGNPLGGILLLSNINFLSSIVTVFWIVWLLNLLSWSNGIDGQYSGIIGISSLVIAVLALRFVPLLPVDVNYAKLAVIAAGCSFGLARYTWHPSKILWGFSAMSAGMVLATLSILINAKVATSVIMLAVPFLDAVVTIGRRLLQRKNPLRGDKGHLHHLLMERGWSVPKIAYFYWLTTAAFGLIGILSSERYTAYVALMVGGVAAFFIILLNLKSLMRKQESLLSAKLSPKVSVPETASSSGSL